MIKKVFLFIFVLSSVGFAASVDKETLKGESFKSFQTLAKGLFLLESLYVEQSKSKLFSLVENALRGAARGLDPHSNYLGPDALKQFRVNTKGKFGGIGVIVTQKNQRLVIVRVVDGSPAMRAGIKKGDQIIAINKTKVENLGDPMKAMQGAVGSKIGLSVLRSSAQRPLEFSVRREIVKLKSVVASELSEGLIRLKVNSFQEDTSIAISQAISRLGSKARGVLVDLRGNPGGLLSKSIEIMDMFLASGVILFTVGRGKGNVQVEYASSTAPFSRIPVVVLVDGASASASEIVAGVFQDYKRGLVMGEKTFGKGSVQTLVGLPNGGGLKVTVAKYRLPLDRTVQGVGLMPDVDLTKIPKKNWLNTAHKALVSMSQLRPQAKTYKVPPQFYN